MTACVGQSEAERTFARIVKPWGRPDPYPEYRRLRELAPVLKSSLPSILGGFVLTSYQDCSAFLRDQSFASMDPFRMSSVNPQWSESPTSRLVHQGIGFQNAPEHDRLRRLMAPHFAARYVAQLHTLIAEMAEDVLDSLECQAKQETVVDFVETVARPLPVRVMRKLFGLDHRRAHRLAILGHTVATVLDPLRSPAQQHRMEVATAEMVEIFGELVRETAAEPNGSVLASVIEACGGEPDDPALLGNLIYLFTAGHETLVGFLGLATSALLNNPEQADLLRTEPDWAANAVEELLRYDAPIQVLIRIATEQVRLGEFVAEPATPVLAILGAANRDPDRIADPDRLDITRTAPRPLSFGIGPHYCLGAYLARMEANILLPRLLERFPRLRAAGAASYRAPGVALRSIEHLPVRI